MTDAPKNAALFIGGLAVGALALWLLSIAIRPEVPGDVHIMTPEEDDIRVKGGSIVLETDSTDGFRFKTKRKTRDCVDVSVTRGACVGGILEAKNVSRVTLTSSDTSSDPTITTHDVVLGGEFGLAAPGWVPSSDFKSLTFSGGTGDRAAFLMKVEAFTKGTLVLSCTSPQPVPTQPQDRMEAFLDLCK